MDVVVNMWGVGTATVSVMIVGSVWYSRAVFGEEWMKLTKLSKKKAKAGAIVGIIAMAAFAFLAAYVLAYLTFIVDAFYDAISYSEAAGLTALLVWVGFSVYYIVPSAIFEQRRKKLTLINLGNSLVSIVVMAIAIGAIGL